MQCKISQTALPGACAKYTSKRVASRMLRLDPPTHRRTRSWGTRRRPGTGTMISTAHSGRDRPPSIPWRRSLALPNTAVDFIVPVPGRLRVPHDLVRLCIAVSGWGILAAPLVDVDLSQAAGNLIHLVGPACSVGSNIYACGGCGLSSIRASGFSVMSMAGVHTLRQGLWSSPAKVTTVLAPENFSTWLNCVAADRKHDVSILLEPEDDSLYSWPVHSDLLDSPIIQAFIPIQQQPIAMAARRLFTVLGKTICAIICIHRPYCTSSPMSSQYFQDSCFSGRGAVPANSMHSVLHK